MTTFTPGQPVPPNDPLALHEPKSLSPLIGAGFALWRRQPGIFFMTAALIVIPFEVIVLGLLGGGFNDPEATAAPWAEASSLLFVSTLGTALVTATHSRAVVALSRGETLTTGDAFKLGLTGFAGVLLAGVLWTLASVFGLLLLLVPGIFISVAGIFAAQIAALEGTGPLASLKASVRLVRAAGWWRTWGYLIVITLISTAMAIIVGAVAGILAAVVDASWFGSIFIVVLAIIEAAMLSFTALVTTLLYFSWKAQTGAAAEPTGAAAL